MRSARFGCPKHIVRLHSEHHGTPCIESTERRTAGENHAVNATLQQHLTVVRLFHDFLVEENICTRLAKAAGGRSLVQRRLPSVIPIPYRMGVLT